MVRVLTALVLSLAIATAYSGTWVNAPYWVVALQCSHHEECFAASNGSYTLSLSGARHFDDPAKAEEFIGTLTSTIREKSPAVQQRFEPVCVTQPGELGSDCGPRPD
jgi:hypothetical protein